MLQRPCLVCNEKGFDLQFKNLAFGQFMSVSAGSYKVILGRRVKVKSKNM